MLFGYKYVLFWWAVEEKTPCSELTFSKQLLTVDVTKYIPGITSQTLVWRAKVSRGSQILGCASNHCQVLGSRNSLLWLKTTHLILNYIHIIIFIYLQWYIEKRSLLPESWDSGLTLPEAVKYLWEVCERRAGCCVNPSPSLGLISFLFTDKVV